MDLCEPAAISSAAKQPASTVSSQNILSTTQANRPNKAADRKSMRGGERKAKGATKSTDFAAAPPIPDAVPVGSSGRLFWLSSSSVPRNSSHSYFFTTDFTYIYEPFFADFGPLHLGHVYRYCDLLEEKLCDPSLLNKRIIHYCQTDPRFRPNSVFLICAYQIIVNNMSAAEAYRPFEDVYPPLLPYRDATYGRCSYHLHVVDCLKGLEFAIKLGWFDRASFDIDQYEKYERVENGDMNWIIPSKFVAFSGPSSCSPDREGFLAFTPEDYIDIFRSLGVHMVVRLNKKQYDRKKFLIHGIQHTDLYFLDGSCPSREIIRKFITIAEKETGALAVHCKAGLGRTGTLIGCYAMKNYHFPATHWIGWNRICRPGSILGPQQHFLTDVQDEMFSLPMCSFIVPVHPKNLRTSKSNTKNETENDSVNCIAMAEMSIEDKKTAECGDIGQGERLCLAKRKVADGPLLKFSSGSRRSDTNTPTSTRTPSSTSPVSDVGESDLQTPLAASLTPPSDESCMSRSGPSMKPLPVRGDSAVELCGADSVQLSRRSSTVEATSTEMKDAVDVPTSPSVPSVLDKTVKVASHESTPARKRSHSASLSRFFRMHSQAGGVATSTSAVTLQDETTPTSVTSKGSHRLHLIRSHRHDTSSSQLGTTVKSTSGSHLMARFLRGRSGARETVE